MYMDWRTRQFTNRMSAYRPQIFGAGRFLPPRPGIDQYQYGDGLLSFVKKAAGALGKVAGAALNLVPGGGLIKSGLKVAGSLIGLGGAAAAGGAAVQALTPAAAAPQLPATIPGMAGVAVPTAAAGAGIGGAVAKLLPWWKGPGGKLQFPWQDPQQILQPPYAYDDSYLRIQYRAPRGYVVVKDPQGRRYAMAKPIARAMGMWTASRKPPISAGDWHKYQTAQVVEKKLRKLASKALRKRGRGGKRADGIFTEQRAIVHRKAA